MPVNEVIDPELLPLANELAVIGNRACNLIEELHGLTSKADDIKTSLLGLAIKADRLREKVITGRCPD